jgi:hypothetical protein
MSGIRGRFDIRRYWSRALIVGLAVIAAGAVAIGQETREVYGATAIGTGGPQPPVAGRLTFLIDRWTTADDAQKLATAVKKGSSKDVVEALRDLKGVGRISSPGSIGYPLQYAVQDTLPDGSRHIVLMTDRPLSFAEAWFQPATVDYPVTYIELKVDKDGKGTGKMAMAAKLISAGKLIVAEDWGSLIQLNDVKKQS